MSAVPKQWCKVYLMHGPGHEADIQHAIIAPEYATRYNKTGNMQAAALNIAQCIHHKRHSLS